VARKRILIEHKKSLDEALRQSLEAGGYQICDLEEPHDERLRIALRAARTGTWHWDLSTNIDTIDDSLRDLFGLRSTQDIQTIEDFFGIVHPDDRARVEAAFEETRTHGVHLNIEFRVVHPDGSERWLLDQGEVVRREGEGPYMSGACVDITQRIAAEQSLRMIEPRFLLLVNIVRDYALFQMDIEGRFTSWNSGAENVLGYKPEEVIGEYASLLFTPEDIAAGVPELEMSQAAKSGRAQDERWHLRKGGVRFWCNGVLTAVFDEDGRLTGFVKVMRDETERRLMHNQLQASLAEKEVLLQEIHHRVKNNLQVITSLISLQSDVVKEEPVRRMFEEACNRVRAIAEIHELLYRSPDLARIDFGAYLKRLGQNLRAFYGAQAQHIRLEIHSDVNLPLTEAIPCGLIVNELVTNSLTHAFPGDRKGRIEVSLGCSPQQCILKVTDDGVGIPSDFRVEDANSLGLKLVSVLAQQLKGEVQIRNSRGTAISVSFPNTAGVS
jgi:PAS domain S-box-containing protein